MYESSIYLPGDQEPYLPVPGLKY